MKWVRELIKRIDQATKPRNPETEYGDESTLKATEDVRTKGTPIKILTD